MIFLYTLFVVIRISMEETPRTTTNTEARLCFVFAFGDFVLWGITATQMLL